MKYSNERNVQLMIALLKAHSIRKVIASPGTTNVTFIGSLMHDPYFEIFSAVDERSAAYMACGLSEESGEPVVISCTGATASRNYFPGLTEAYYRKLPILAITSTREECKIGHLIDQQIDRTRQPKDTVVCSEHLQIIKDDEDWWDCTIKANRAILALKANGGGPSHINLPTLYSPDFTIESLPPVRKIERYYIYNNFPDIGSRDVAVFIGTHRKMTKQEQNALDCFCECYNAVVYCDICCGYHGKYGLSMFGASSNLKVDLLIHIGEVSCSAYGCKPNEVWRVNEDGELRDTYRKLTKVFAMPEFYFFSHYSENRPTQSMVKFNTILAEAEKKYENLNDVPFSNGWIAMYLHDKLPYGSIVHLGIVSTYFVWNKFRLHDSINVVCNQGGFGIDGNLSTLIGASFVNPNKIYYCFLGDLAFFYDMNVLGNRHVGNNVRILLVNNGRGAIFRKPGNFASMFQDEADEYIAAAGHFAKQSTKLVKDYAEDLGFEYITAKTKEEFKANLGAFVNKEMSKKPILFEVFVSIEDEILGDEISHGNPKGIRKIAMSLLGEGLYCDVRDFLKNRRKGSMGVDVSHN